MKQFSLLILLLLFVGQTRAQAINFTYDTGSQFPLQIRDIQGTSDGGYIAAFDMEYIESSQTSVKAGILKMDLYGYIEWAKTLDIPSAQASCSFNVVQVADGNYLLHGLLYSGLTFNMVPTLSKFDQSGNVMFYKEFPLPVASGSYSVGRMYKLPNGNVQILASIYNEVLTSQLTPNGDVVWAKSLFNDTLGTGKNPGFDILPMTDGKFLATAKTSQDLSVTKFDANGNVEWNNSQSIGMYCHIKSVIETSSNGVFAVGYVEDLGGGFASLLKLDPADGSVIWMKKIEYPNAYDYGFSKIFDEGDGILITYPIKANPAITYESFLKFDYNGNLVWSNRTDPLIAKQEYGAIAKVSGDYLYGGYAQSASLGSDLAFLHKTSDISDLGCLSQPDTNVQVSDYFDFQDTTHSQFVNDYQVSSIIERDIELSDVTTQLGEICVLLSTDPESSKEVKVYPVPSNNLVNFQIQPWMIGGEYQLFNMSGQQLLSSSLTNEVEQINVGEFSEGIYILKIQANGLSISQKISVAR